jgi:DNA polymerase-1
LGHLRKKDQDYTTRLHELFHRSRLQTILERYLVVEGDIDGRVRPTIKLGGTETGRFAYAGGPGEAVQQWPHEIRGLIRARPGFVFVGRDYSQIEARILAVLSQDYLSLATFAKGRDVHEQNCRDLFGLTVSEYDSLDPTRKVALRNYAKTFLYGLSYGGKADTIKMKLFCPCWRCISKAPPQVNLSTVEIKRAAARWETAHDAIMTWRAWLVDSVYGYGQDRTWTSPFGWRCRMWESQAEGERSLMNRPMQHCASVIINRAMVRLQRLGVPLSLQMHDELIAEVPEADAERTLTLMGEIMEIPVPELANTIFPTSSGSGQTWADLK